MNICLKVIVIV